MTDELESGPGKLLYALTSTKYTAEIEAGETLSLSILDEVPERFDFSILDEYTGCDECSPYLTIDNHNLKYEITNSDLVKNHPEAWKTF